MGELLNNNIFFVYLLGIIVIINYSSYTKYQKIAIIYICNYGLTFNKEIRISWVLILMLVLLFLYEEYLDLDIIKRLFIISFSRKILDFFYMYVFQYKILLIIFAIFMQSQVIFDFFGSLSFMEEMEMITRILKDILMSISIICLILGVHSIFKNEMELKDFSNMNKKFQQYPYYLLPLSDVRKRETLLRKLELVADIEDYTFFERKNSYSSFSIEFIKVWLKIKKRNNKERKVTYKNKSILWKKVLYYIKNFCRRRSIKSMFSFMKINKKRKGPVNATTIIFIREWITKKIIYLKVRIKRYTRGYSTIEMQLIRILGYEKGLVLGKPHNIGEAFKILKRKIYEIIYAKLFFDGMKRNLGISSNTSYFRYYIVYIYLHTVQTTLNGKRFAPLDKVFGEVEVWNWPDEALFIIILGLNGRRITEKRVLLYEHIIDKYQLNRELINELVKNIQ